MVTAAMSLRIEIFSISCNTSLSILCDIVRHIAKGRDASRNDVVVCSQFRRSSHRVASRAPATYCEPGFM